MTIEAIVIGKVILPINEFDFLLIFSIAKANNLSEGGGCQKYILLIKKYIIKHSFLQYQKFTDTNFSSPEKYSSEFCESYMYISYNL